MQLTHLPARDKDDQPQNVDQTNTRRKMMPRSGAAGSYQSHRPRLFLLQMPVILARGIGDISIHNISNYTSNNVHSGTTLTGIDLMK